VRVAACNYVLLSLNRPSDLDAFYAQVESKRLGLPPDTPLCVQQWNGVIAVNYAARALGISRFDRASDIRSKHPQCVLAHCATVDAEDGGKECAEVNPQTQKISLERYRVASAAIFEVFSNAGCLVERASIDEAYFDVSSLVSDTMALGGSCLQQPIAAFPPIPCGFLAGPHMPKTPDCSFLPQVGWVTGALSPDAECDTRIAVAAAIAAQLRAAVLSTCGYTCSAGIAHSKLLAKLGSALHKPSGQTTIPLSSISALMQSTPLQSIRYLGGKLGHELKAGGFNTAGDVMQGDRRAVAACVGDDSVAFVLEVCCGELDESVTPRGPPATMLASKSFLQPLNSAEECNQWLRVLACELVNRLHKDEGAFDRRPSKLTLHYRSSYTHPSVGNRSKSSAAMKNQASGASAGSSHVCNLAPRGGVVDADCIVSAAAAVLSRAAAAGAFPCSHISLTLSGFVAREGTRNITSFFGAMAAAAAATAAEEICGSSGCSPIKTTGAFADCVSSSDDDDKNTCAAAVIFEGSESELNVDCEATHLAVNSVHNAHASFALEAAAVNMAAAPLSSLVSPSRSKSAVATKLMTTATVVDIQEDEDECVIIESSAKAASSSLSASSAAAARQVRCPECSTWLVGDTALRLHLDEHVAQKFQVPLQQLFHFCFFVHTFIAAGL
jgi:DNA polymerase eta